MKEDITARRRQRESLNRRITAAGAGLKGDYGRHKHGPSKYSRKKWRYACKLSGSGP
jgi:hypothetical protein